MNHFDEEERPTIGMLLDIEHLYGEHEGRMGPLLMTLGIAALPILIYVYFSMWLFFPIWLFVPIEIVVIILVIMWIPGRMKYRMNIFRRQLYDEYASTASLMNIKTIHPDGCVEYVNGQILYLVCCFNGTCEDEVRRSVQVRNLLRTLLGDYVFDIYIHNITNMPALREYYDKASHFNKNESAKNFIKIIDYTLQLTQDYSMLQCTIYAVKGKRSDWKEIKTQIDIAVKSKVSNVYKTIYRVKEPLIINDIINRNVDSTINIEDLLRNKYATKDYDSSKVLAYDLPEDREIVQGRNRTVPIIPEAPSYGFHVAFEEASE